MPCRLRCCLEGIRLKLVFQKIITIALIDQNRQLFRCLGEQGAGIPFAPARTFIAEVARERLFAPRALARVADRRKGRQRLITPRVAQRADQRTVPAHGVAADAALVGYREIRLDQRRQLLNHVVVHAVMPCPGFLGGVQIETRTETEVPGLIRIIRHIGAARAGIRCDDDHPQLGRQLMCAGLLHKVLIGAGQSTQPIQHRQFAALLGLWRQVHGKHHVTAQHRRAMAVAFMPATGTLLAGNIFQGHKASSGRP